MVQAATKQMAMISTNNRFVHDELVRFAERICKVLPSSLSIVYFVNSGSEANDLALRLAMAHTGKEGIATLN